VKDRVAHSRASRWRTAVLIAVHLAFLVHLAHWLARGETLSPLEPSEAMELGKRGIVNAGAVFFGLAILSTAVFGRFFCGWGCHLVALQDLCRWLLRRLGIQPRPLRSRALLWVPTVAFVYMFLWPAVYKLWTGQPWPPVQVHLTTSDFWATFPGWGVALLTFAVCGFVAVYALGAKGFCTYACPYGAAFARATRLAPAGIRVSDACQGCAHCTAACTSNVRVHEEVRDFGMVVDPGCMKCLDCVSVCPNDALRVGWGRPAALTRPRGTPVRRPRLGWGEELVLAGAFAAAFVTFRGLYGLVPFLLSLGLSSVLAAGVLLVVRLVRREEVRFGGFRLKGEGRLLPAGRFALALAAPVLLLWGHSALVRVHEHLGDRLFARTGQLRAASLDLERPLRPVTGPDLELVERAAGHLAWVGRWGLVRDPQRELQLAWMELLAGRTESGRQRLQGVLADRPRAPEPYLLAGRDLVERGRPREAVLAYAKALEVDPRSAAGYLGLGSLLASLGDLEPALRVFERGLEALPNNPDLLYNAGVASAVAGDVDGAVDRFLRVLAIAPRHRQARENLAGALLALGRPGEALPHLQAAVEQTPDDAGNHLLLGRALLAVGDRAGAAAALERALALDPSLDEARSLEAQVLEGR
jgi:polyferredoxin/tetratricopeptide (TPR) repeat protein